MKKTSQFHENSGYFFDEKMTKFSSNKSELWRVTAPGKRACVFCIFENFLSDREKPVRSLTKAGCMKEVQQQLLSDGNRRFSLLKKVKILGAKNGPIWSCFFAIFWQKNESFLSHFLSNFLLKKVIIFCAFFAQKITQKLTHFFSKNAKMPFFAKKCPRFQTGFWGVTSTSGGLIAGPTRQKVCHFLKWKMHTFFTFWHFFRTFFSAKKRASRPQFWHPKKHDMCVISLCTLNRGFFECY